MALHKVWMEELKERIFQFGIYGQRKSSLTEAELVLASEAPWIEFVSEDGMETLRQNFTTSRLHTADGPYIRMDPLEWKSYLTSSTGFNFTSKEYYLIMDLLITRGDYVDNIELRRLSIDPKKMHYCVNKLAEKGLIEYRSIEGGESGNLLYKIRVLKDSRGFVIKKIPGEKKREESRGIDTSQLEYVVALGLKDNVMELFARSPKGITTSDLSRRLGIKEKAGCKVLKYIHDTFGTLEKVEEFEGRCRRHRYFLKEGARGGDAHQEKVSITKGERIEAIKKLLEKNPVLGLDKFTFKSLKKLTGWKYHFDRRTILRAAVAAGFQIHKNVRSKGNVSRYLITRPGYDISTYKAGDGALKDFNEFQTRIYKAFVASQNFVEGDNGYLLAKRDRALLFYDYLHDHQRRHGTSIIKLDWDLVKEMSARLVLSIVPFRRMGFKQYLLYLLDPGRREERASLRDFENEYLALVDTDARYGRAAEDELLSIKVEDLLKTKMPQSLFNYIRSKIAIHNFGSSVRSLKKALVVGVRGGDEVELARLDRGEIEARISRIKGANKSSAFVDLSRRIAFFRDVYLADEEHFYGLALESLQKRFSGNELSLMHDKLRMLMPEEEEAQDHNVHELYMQFKRRIIETGSLGGVQYDESGILGVKGALRMLAKDKVISNYTGPRALDAVKINEKFKRRIGKRYDTAHFRNYDELRGSGYFSHFFDAVYHAIATSGSMEVSRLQSKVKTVADFEMELFLRRYEDVFEVTERSGLSFVSLKAVADPFSV
jgi:hypothetical protein